MSYDHWKTTEPESGYDPPEPSLEETYEREMGQMEARLKLLRETAFSINAENAKYKGALRKIAAWKGYAPAPIWFDSDVPLTDYERGTNDAIAILKQIAKEALA
jgi:hypothetical protein